MSGHTVDTAEDVRAVLWSPIAAPPPRSGPGPTLALRNAMARFAGPADHPERRRAVVAAAERLDLTKVGEVAARVAAAMLCGEEIDAMALARTAPVVAVAEAAGLIDPDDPDAAAALVGDIEAVAAVVGRGTPPTQASDAATERLLALAAGRRHDPVALVSLLSQSLDATAALITTTLDAEAHGRPRTAAVSRTERVVLGSGMLAGRRVEPGDAIEVHLGRAGMEFGAGPHACPGEAIACRVADAVVAAIGAAGYRADPGRVHRDADGRPTAMPLTAGHV